MNVPNYLGPPVLADPPLTKPPYYRTFPQAPDCLVRGADGVVMHGPCEAPATQLPAPVVSTVVAAAPAAQTEISWTMLALIGVGIYLLTKG